MGDATEYNTQSAEGQIRVDWDDLEDNGQLGDWAFLIDAQGNTTLLIRQPDGTERGWLSGIPLAPNPKEKICWDWDGNKEAPTVTPSIHRLPNWNRPGWHGFMRAGKLESC